MSTAAAQPPAGASHDAGLFCPGCGYDLRGSEGSARCPECGLAIDRASLASATVPWVHRRVVGSGRAYRKTLRLAMLHPARMAAAVGAAHRWDDARRFRARTARRACVLPFTVIVVLYGVTLSVPNRPRELRGLSYQIGQLLKPLGLDWLVQGRRPDFTSAAYIAELAVLLTTLAGAYLAALAAASVAGYFFRSVRVPASAQARAAALGAYASAPLALLAPATLLLLLAGYETACWSVPRAGFGISPASPYWLDTFPRVTLLALALAAAPWVWTWVTTLRLLRHATRGHDYSTARLIAATIGLPLAWAVLPLLIILGAFACALIVATMVVSFT